MKTIVEIEDMTLGTAGRGLFKTGYCNVLQPDLPLL
jgi:hypothetical protein